MSEVCEVLEELVTATSAAPATDIIAVQVAAGSGSSLSVLGIVAPTLISLASAVSPVATDAYALITETVQATDSVSTLLVATEAITARARGRSFTVAAYFEDALSVANADGSIVALAAPLLLESQAHGTSVLTASTSVTAQAAASALATSSTVLGLLDTVTGAAEAVSSATAFRRVEAAPDSNAAASSELFASAEPQGEVFLSLGEAGSELLTQLEAQALLACPAVASSGVWFKDPDKVAWVMNTETSAASWYDNFDFQTLAQPPGKVLAVGPDGLYELAGSTDSGEQIDAKVVSGFTDFGTAQTKRMDSIYFGYNSDGTLRVTVETYESGHLPASYILEQRLAAVPRNSRIVPGKGLWGRYWRLTVSNLDGADFEVHDAAVDIAVSSRRV